jgi:gamma-glutamyltranspeptidase/glutathione hydrolase/leukotriene-C4 hydrolase
MPPPGSGILTAFILNILDGHIESENTGRSSRDPTNYHRIAEAFKHAFAQRSKLADPNFVPEVNEVRSNHEVTKSFVEYLKPIFFFFLVD